MGTIVTLLILFILVVLTIFMIESITDGDLKFWEKVEQVTMWNFLIIIYCLLLYRSING